MAKKPELPFVALQLMVRSAAGHVARRLYMERIFEQYLQYTRRESVWVTMPCGEKYVFNDKNFPSDNQFCRCGDSGHVVVLWRTMDVPGYEGE